MGRLDHASLALQAGDERRSIYEPALGTTAGWEPAQVVGLERDEAATTLRLLLSRTPQWSAGQYYLVRAAMGTTRRAVQQAYSLSSSPYPASDEVDITVRPVAGGRLSPLLAEHVEVGDLLQVQGPYGFLTWSEDDGGPLVLVGGGSSVAPLLSIVRYAAARHLDVSMTLLCSSRDRESVLLRQPLESLAREHGWFTIIHTFTRSPLDPCARFHRRVDEPMLGEVMDRAGTRVSEPSFYVAGPGAMVLSVRGALEGLGAAPGAIFSEDHT